MARVTVEDCLDNVGNRFALVMMAVKRVRRLKQGDPVLVRSRNKEAVTALREIASGAITYEEDPFSKITVAKKLFSSH